MGCAIPKCGEERGQSREELPMVVGAPDTNQEPTTSQPVSSQPGSSQPVLSRAQSLPTKTKEPCHRKMSDLILSDKRGKKSTSVDIPSSSGSSQLSNYQSRQAVDFLDDYEYFKYKRKRASKSPSTFALIKRTLFYKSYPLPMARRRSMERRMKKQKFTVNEGQHVLFREANRSSGCSSASNTSKGGKSVRSLPVTYVSDMKRNSYFHH